MLMPPILRVIHQFFVKNPRKIKKIDPDLKEMPAQQPPAVAPDIPDLTEEVVKGLKDVKYNVYVRPPPPSAPVPVTVDRLRELVVAVINANANVGPGGRLRVAASGAIEQAWDHETADPVLEAEALKADKDANEPGSARLPLMAKLLVPQPGFAKVF